MPKGVPNKIYSGQFKVKVVDTMYRRHFFLFDDLEGDKVVRNNVFTRKITYQMTDQSRTEYYSVIK